MKLSFKILIVKFIIIISFFSHINSHADNHNIYEILEQIQKDVKTLEKAVYSGSLQLDNQYLRGLKSLIYFN